MAISSITGAIISGITSILPEVIEDNLNLTESLNKEEMARVIASTGISSRRVVLPNQTCLDLAKIAARDLIDQLDWHVSDIGLIIFVTQTPDFPLPGNAVQLQNMLGLNKTTVAFDVNLGCSGFVYGLWQTSQLLLGLEASKALLIVGDTTSTQYSKSNHAVASLFGDAVSTIAIEKSKDSGVMSFSFGSDGSGTPYLIQPNGGAINPNIPSEMFMDGAQVFVFTLREIPKSVLECLKRQGWSVDDLDYVIMHQANKMMLEHLAEKLGVPKKKLVISMAETGNTSSASIPLAMCLNLQNELKRGNKKLLLSGFGVGWSWATVAFELLPVKVCRLIDLSETDDTKGT